MRPDNASGPSLREVWKSLRGTAKIQFLWDYFKLPLFLICVLIYVICYLVFRSLHAETPQLYLAYVNLEAGETLNRHLTEDFIAALHPNERHSVVKVLDHLALTENLQQVDGSYVYASQMKILSAIESQILDIVLMNQEAFDAFSQNGFLCDLDTFSETYDLAELKPYFVENIEILSDNATDVLLDPSVDYQSETVSYPMAINISSFPYIQEAGFPDDVFLGVIANTTRGRNAASFITYLADDT